MPGTFQPPAGRCGAFPAFWHSTSSLHLRNSAKYTPVGSNNQAPQSFMFGTGEYECCEQFQIDTLLLSDEGAEDGEPGTFLNDGGIAHELEV